MFSPVNLFGLNVYPLLLVVQGAIFLLSLWILNKGLFGPILKILQEREERTEGFLCESERTEERARKTLEQYKEEFSLAMKEARDLKRKYVSEGTEKKEKILEKAIREARLFLEEIRGEISKEAESTRKALYKQVESLGKNLAGKVLGRSV